MHARPPENNIILYTEIKYFHGGWRRVGFLAGELLLLLVDVAFSLVDAHKNRRAYRTMALFIGVIVAAAAAAVVYTWCTAVI